MTDREILRSMGIVVTVNLASRYINISAPQGIDLGGLEGEFRQSDIDSGQDPDDVLRHQMERNLVKRLLA